MMPDDRDLAARFQRLRAEELNRVPSLARLVRPQPGARSLRIWVLTTAGLCAGIALVWLVHDMPHSSDPGARGPQFTTAGWVAPTDFLLATPDRELLTKTPEFGWSHGWYPLKDTSPRRNGS